MAGETGHYVGADGVARVTGAGGVIAQLRAEGEAREQRGDGRDGPAGDDMVGEIAGVTEEGFVLAEGKFVGSVDGGDIADVGRSGTVVEVGQCGDFDVGWRIGRDGGVPGGAVVEVLGPGVVSAELETMNLDDGSAWNTSVS